MNHYYNMEVIDEIIDALKSEYGEKKFSELQKYMNLVVVFHNDYSFLLIIDY